MKPEAVVCRFLVEVFFGIVCRKVFWRVVGVVVVFDALDVIVIVGDDVAVVETKRRIFRRRINIIIDKSCLRLAVCAEIRKVWKPIFKTVT